MLSRSSALLVALSAGLVAGIAYPYVDIAIACRAPMSEACVWGKAYFSLTLTVSVVLLGGMVAGVVYVVLGWRRDRQSRGDAV